MTEDVLYVDVKSRTLPDGRETEFVLAIELLEGHDGEWWRITEEYDVMGRNPQFFLRLWEKDKDAGKTVLKSSGFAPIDTLARAQEGAREYETKQVS